MKLQLLQPLAVHQLGQRDNQEDSIYPSEGVATASNWFFIVCDGMGGHERGEVASDTVCKALADYLQNNLSPETVITNEQLLAALNYAYKQLDGIDSDALRKPGTTLTMLVFHRGGATAMHIGDSRIYHVRTSERRLLYQSRDHSLVFDLYQSGEITYEEMATHPKKNIITRAMQPGEDNRVRPDIIRISDIKPSDYFYLCTDGMLEKMTNNELLDILCTDDTNEAKRQQLKTLTDGNKDNHSAYLIQVDTVTSEAGDEALVNEEPTARCNALNVHPKKQEHNADVAIVSYPIAPQGAQRSLKAQKRIPKNNQKAWIIAVAVVALLAIGFVVFQNFFQGDESTENGIEQIAAPEHPAASPYEEAESVTTGKEELDAKPLMDDKSEEAPNSASKPGPAPKPKAHDNSVVDKLKSQSAKEVKKAETKSEKKTDKKRESKVVKKSEVNKDTKTKEI